MIAKVFQPFFVMLAMLLALCSAVAEEPSSSPKSKPEFGERHTRLKLDRMVKAQQISAEQEKYIRFILQQQQDMISLFAVYGLLSPEQMFQKKEQILEATNLQIAFLFTDAQRARWDTLDQRLYSPRDRLVVR